MELAIDNSLRTELDAASDDIRQRFLDGESVLTLVRERSDLVDSVLTHLWRQHAPDCVGVAALIAVGGAWRERSSAWRHCIVLSPVRTSN